MKVLKTKLAESRKWLTFDGVPLGLCFVYKDEVYMKVHPVVGTITNAVKMENGMLYFIADRVIVYAFDAKVVEL